MLATVIAHRITWTSSVRGSVSFHLLTFPLSYFRSVIDSVSSDAFIEVQHITVL